MKLQNTGKSDIILGGVHNGRYAEQAIHIAPNEVVELSPERLQCYAPEDLAALKPPSAKRAEPKPPSEPKEPAKDDEEIASEELLGLLRGANPS